MSEPTCRRCYAATLTAAQRERFFAEPITTCVYLCPEHQAEQDDLMAHIDWSMLRPSVNRLSTRTAH